MRVALVHDYIKEYGGAERVLEALHEIWPDAPVFTSLYIPSDLGPHKERFNSPAGEWDIRTSIAQFLPFKEKLISPLRLIAPLLFRQFDFSEFDVVIVSATGAYFPNNIRCHPELGSGSKSLEGEMPKPASPVFDVASQRGEQVRNDSIKKPIHICYCHTPPRYLYGYATAREWKNKIVFRVLGEIANHFLRLIDFKAAQNVDYFIANSKEVASRIKKFYRRDSVVIYPPVNVTKINTDDQWISAEKNPRESFYLAGGRLARAKHIDLIVRACEELDVPLKVFGKGFGGVQSSKFKVLASRRSGQSSKVEFVGEVSDEEKFELMRNARAYIFASEDEDFGITPVEAMSVGTPVIAYKSGGVVESVIDEKTGLFFDELSVESLIKAMKKFNNLTINPVDCIKQAQKFSKERFKKEMENLVDKVKENGSR